MVDTHHTTLTDPEIDELAGILMDLQRRVMFSLSQEIAKGKISFAQLFLLGHLQQGGHLSMSEIAQKMSHTTAAATGLVDRLEKLGYLKRTHDTKDRRKIFVSISKKGIDLVDHVHEEMVMKLKKLVNNLTIEEQSCWLSIYRKIWDFCNTCNAK